MINIVLRISLSDILRVSLAIATRLSSTIFLRVARVQQVEPQSRQGRLKIERHLSSNLLPRKDLSHQIAAACRFQ